jgi:Rieske Fe-S protein
MGLEEGRLMQEITRPPTGRRRFINYFLGSTLGATLAAILYPVIRFLGPPRVPEPARTNVVAGKVDELKPNTGKIFKFGTQPGMLVKTPGGDIRAFSATCTHLNCTVQYREDMQHIWCACHNGHYDLNGKNIAGPPPRPLEQYTVNIRGDEIVVSKG